MRALHPSLSALLCALSFALGGLAGWSTRPEPAPTAPPPAPREPAAPSPRAPAPCPPAEAASPALAQCQLMTTLLERQLRVYEGEPQGWPEGVAPAFFGTALRASLAEAWRDKAELRGVDCSEYPCLVTLRLSTDEDSCCQQLNSILPPDLADKRGSQFMLGYEDRGMYAVIPFGDPAQWGDDVELRTRHRVDEAAEILRDDLDAEFGGAGAE